MFKSKHLAHVNLYCSIADIFLAFYAIAKPEIEHNILGKPLIGVKPNSFTAERRGDFFGVSHQLRSQALPLKIRRNRHVLNEQLTFLIDRFDQVDKYVVDIQKIEAVFPDCCPVVSPHRFRLAADHRHPFGVGSPRQVTNGPDIGLGRPSELATIVHRSCRTASVKRIYRHCAKYRQPIEFLSILPCKWPTSALPGSKVGAAIARERRWYSRPGRPARSQARSGPTIQQPNAARG